MENLISKLDKVDISEKAKEALEDGELKWGIELTEIYKLSLKFYKGDKELFLLTRKISNYN